MSEICPTIVEILPIASTAARLSLWMASTLALIPSVAVPNVRPGHSITRIVPGTKEVAGSATIIRWQLPG
jgi:hypothetical protein